MQASCWRSYPLVFRGEDFSPRYQKGTQSPQLRYRYSDATSMPMACPTFPYLIRTARTRTPPLVCCSGAVGPLHHLDTNSMHGLDSSRLRRGYRQYVRTEDDSAGAGEKPLHLNPSPHQPISPSALRTSHLTSRFLEPHHPRSDHYAGSTNQPCVPKPHESATCTGKS